MVVVTIVKKEINRFSAFENATKRFMEWTCYDRSIIDP